VNQPQSTPRSILSAPIVLVFALMLSACGGGGIDRPAPVPAPSKWVIMGSSTAAGTGASTSAKSWAGLLQAGIAANNLLVVNIAKTGATTYEGLATSSPPVAGQPSPDPTVNVTAALAQSPKALLLSYPTNDTALDYSATETVGNLLAIRAAAVAANVRVIVLSTQPRDLSPAQLARLVEIDDAMSAAVGACFVAVRTDLAGVDSKLNTSYDSGDGIHPNDAGHALIHQRVRALIDTGSCVNLAAP
jgi:acyl-CoA thioesterase I